MRCGLIAGAKNSRREEMDRERKRRTNRMLIAMVTVFGVSWLPLNTVNLVNDVNESTGDWPYYNLCFFMVHAIAMSSTCYNPFLYAWLNENFRKEFKQVSLVLPRHNAPHPHYISRQAMFCASKFCFSSLHTYKHSNNCKSRLSEKQKACSGRTFFTAHLGEFSPCTH
jgi:hypothetical protein